MNMAGGIESRRVPWVAVALSLMSAGVGHLYCGRIVRGLPLYFAWLLVPLGATIAALLPASPACLVLLLLLPVAIVFVVYLYAAIDAWRLACHIGSDYSLRDFNRAGVYTFFIFVQIVCSICLIAGMRSFVYEAFVIPSSSMSPTILPGDRILARKLLAQDRVPKRGDLIVFRNPTPTGATRLVGRIVAVAGDHLEISGERLVINSNELERNRVPDQSLNYLGHQVNWRVAIERNFDHSYFVAYGGLTDGGRPQGDFDTTIPERHVFVLGDNRDRSKDSRQFGSISIEDIVGYVDYVYWPSESWSRFGVANDRLP
jgi:signal peptidase I